MTEVNDVPLSGKDASAFLKSLGFPCSEQTLAHKRVAATGPEFLKFNSRVFYRPSALRAWVDDTAKTMTATMPKAA